MILALDNLATRYHCLPSQILSTGTTFDLRVCEVATMWINRQNNPDTHSSKLSSDLSEDQMRQMIERARNRA